MRRILLTFTALSVLAAAPAQADVVVLKPSSPWNADFGTDRCRLAGYFGEGENRHLLFFEQYWPAPGAGLTVAGKSFNRFKDGAATALQTADGRSPLETRPFKGEVDGIGDALVYSGVILGDGQTEPGQAVAGAGLPALDTRYAQGVEYLLFRQRGQEVRFVTGSLGKAFEVLNQCTSSLLTEWGLDADRHKTAQRRPQWTNQQDVVRKIMARYPSGARTIGEQGIMRLRVTVSEAGAVDGCVVLKATNTKKLESPACEAMQEARFDPALDAAGTPMRSYYVTSITYKMP